jgi:hypothetical protein
VHHDVARCGAAFSGPLTTRARSVSFINAGIRALLGEATLDLREATAPHCAQIDALALFGGADVTAPARDDRNSQW